MQPREAQDPHQRTTRFRSVSRARNTRTPALLAVMPASAANSCTETPSTSMRRSASAAEAEIALVVADPVQGKGLGLLLLSRLRDAALERDVTRFTGTVLDENRPMRTLLRKFGGRVGLALRGVCEVDLALN